MNDSRFDRWTRRALGLAVGGVTASFLGPSGRDAAVGKKKKPKKHKKRRHRCLRLGRSCDPAGKQQCCENALCQTRNGGEPDAFVCCKGRRQPCTSDAECCANLACTTFGRICEVN